LNASDSSFHRPRRFTFESKAALESLYFPAFFVALFAPPRALSVGSAAGIIYLCTQSLDLSLQAFFELS
jgi:hypothetical protein